MYLFETKRLNIRESNEDDIKYIMSLEKNDENNKFVFQGTYEEHLEEIKSDSILLFIIEDLHTHDPLGFILSAIQSKYDVFELRRIVIEKKAQGYGQEVIRGLIDYAFNKLSINRFWLDVFPENIRGIHVYEKLGMKHEGTLRASYKRNGVYIDQMIFSILKEEFF